MSKYMPVEEYRDIESEWMIYGYDTIVFQQKVDGLISEKSIDIVRCKECVHWREDKFFCTQWTCGTPAMGWCYMAKQTETQNANKNSNKNSNVISVYGGVSEAVRCAMCSNPNKSDRGCDGACSYDEKLYKRIMDAIDESRVDTPQTDCETCKHNKLEWYSDECDSCSKAHSNYEPQTDNPCEGCTKHICYGCEHQAEKEAWRKAQADCGWK